MTRRDGRRAGIDARRFTGVLGSLGIVVWEADPGSLRFISTTPSLSSLFAALPERDADGWRWGDQIHHDDREAAQETLERALIEGGEHELEYRAADSGIEAWIRDVVRVERPGRSPLGLSGTMVDVSRARRAEADLRETEDTYRQLVENATDILFRTDVFGRFTFVNPTAVARSGYDRDELVGKSYLELIRPDHRQRVRQILERQYVDREPNAYVEFVAMAKDGTEAWIGQNTQLLVEQGRVTGFQAISRDVTERRNAEEALAESEHRYRLLADNALDLIGLYSLAGDVIYASPSHERALGWSADELAARTLFDLVDERDERAVRDAIRTVLETAVPSHLDIRIPTRDGSAVLLDALVSVVRDDSGVRALIVGRDITVRRETESRLAGERATVSRLQSLDEIRKTFVLALAHDLRAPVTAIQGSAATLLRTDVALDSEQERAFLHGVLANARRLERMLTDLLDVERLDRGQIGADRRDVDVAERLDAIVADRIESGGRAIDMRVDVGHAWVDPVMLDRIALNLLSNAARHASLGDHIGLRARWAPAEPDALLITVEDTGPGVPDDMKEAVFERFRRGPGMENQPGVGIGLWLVASFARLHGGETWVEDREGGGAVFNVLLRDARSEPDPLREPVSGS